MSFLQSAPNVLQTVDHANARREKAIASVGNDSNLRHQHILSKGGVLSPLFRLITNPTSILTSLVDSLRDEHAADARAKAVAVENRKTILYALMGNVSTAGP